VSNLPPWPGPGPDTNADKMRVQIDVALVKSVALQRIIDEVRNNQDTPLSGYNRVYHRHNR